MSDPSAGWSTAPNTPCQLASWSTSPPGVLRHHRGSPRCSPCGEVGQGRRGRGDGDRPHTQVGSRRPRCRDPTPLYPYARGAHLRVRSGRRQGASLPEHRRSPHASRGLYMEYRPPRRAAGREDLRWHDLRIGATMAAQARATTRELMTRLGHHHLGRRYALPTRRRRPARRDRATAVQDGWLKSSARGWSVWDTRGRAEESDMRITRSLT